MSSNNNNPRNSNNDDDDQHDDVYGLNPILRLITRRNIPYRWEGPSTLSVDLGFIGSITEAMFGLVNDTVLSLGGLHVISENYSPNPPAAAVAVEALEKFRYVGAAEACPVCLDEFVAGSELTRMPCSHHFHGHCLLKWLEKNDTCPICRFKLPN